MNAARFEPAATLGDTEPGELDALEHPAVVAANDAVRLPWWFWEAAAVVFAATIAVSAVWPLGVAS